MIDEEEPPEGTSDLSDDFAALKLRELLMQPDGVEQVATELLALPPLRLEGALVEVLRLAKWAFVAEEVARSVDPRTQILNEQGFVARVRPILSIAIRSKKPVAMLCVDIVGLGEINNNPLRGGRREGNRQIRAVASAIKETAKEIARETDYYCRAGDAADEFFIFFSPPAGHQALARFEAELLRRLEHHSLPATDELPLGSQVQVYFGWYAWKSRTGREDLGVVLDEMFHEASGRLNKQGSR